MIKRKDLCTGLASGLLLLAASSAHALPVTYNFSITGTVDVVGTQTVTVTQNNVVTSSSTTTLANAFGLNAGDTITAYGTFTADWGPSVSGTVYYDLAAFNATGNAFTIDMNGAQAGGTLLYASDDNVYSGGWPYMTFTNGALTDFDYFKTTAPKFNSSFTYFDDMTSSVSSSTVVTGNGKNAVTTVTTTTIESMFGHWGPTVVTAVPEASTYAMMLAGLGLVGFMRAAHRKKLMAAA